MSNKLYWVWAQNALGISASVKSDEIVSYFGNAEKLYYAGEYEWKISGIFTNGQINKLKSTSIDSAEKIVAECEKYKIKIVTPDDDNYPSMLFKLPNLPLVLYVRGDLDCLKNKIAVAMVGAREASDIGVRIARSLSASLSRSGAVVISGAAKGIDSAAHTGALNVGAKTVAVLGAADSERIIFPKTSRSDERSHTTAHLLRNIRRELPLSDTISRSETVLSRVFPTERLL